MSALLQQPGASLITLLGPGGVGKTRLALHLAHELAPSFADVVRFVDLAPVRDPDLVLQAITQALGTSPNSASPPSRLLLLLDNCEHLTGAAPHLAALLGDEPRITILATSREVLRIADEQVVPIAPLALPESGRQLPIDELAGVAAIHLFVDRATAADARFSLTTTNAAAVTEIVRQVDGLPLAIELAAAQIRHLTPERLRDRLEQRLPLLAHGWRDRPPRLQTMRDAIAWSYDLLTDDERALFRALSVFAGGFTLPGAELAAQTLDPPRSGGDLFELVASLVDKSLLVHDPVANRYRMLETIREFAVLQLVVCGESDRAHAALVASIEMITGAIQPARFHTDYRIWLRNLETEHANLSAALVWLDRTGRTERLVRLIAALCWFWYDQGHLHEGRRWLEHALTIEDGAPASSHTRMAAALGMILLPLGEIDEARRVLATGLAIAEHRGFVIETAHLLVVFGGLLIADDRPTEAIPLFNRALQLARSSGDSPEARSTVNAALANLGVISRGMECFDEAQRYHEAALAGQRALGSARGEALSLIDLGDLARDRDDAPAAARWYREGLRVSWELGEKRAISDVLSGLACAAVSLHQFERAARLFATADRVRALAGIARLFPPGDSLASERALAAARAALGHVQFNLIRESSQACSLEQLIEDALTAPVEISSRQAPVLFTRREMEVLRLLVEGRTDRAIGDALFINVRTVENHVARIFAKLGVRTRTAAATRAISAGLVPASVE